MDIKMTVLWEYRETRQCCDGASHFSQLKENGANAWGTPFDYTVCTCPTTK